MSSTPKTTTERGHRGARFARRLSLVRPQSRQGQPAAPPSGTREPGRQWPTRGCRSDGRTLDVHADRKGVPTNLVQWLEPAVCLRWFETSLGGDGGIRTLTGGGLSALPLPVGLRPRNYVEMQEETQAPQNEHSNWEMETVDGCACPGPSESHTRSTTLQHRCLTIAEPRMADFIGRCRLAGRAEGTHRVGFARERDTRGPRRHFLAGTIAGPAPGQRRTIAGLSPGPAPRARRHGAPISSATSPRCRATGQIPWSLAGAIPMPAILPRCHWTEILLGQMRPTIDASPPTTRMHHLLHPRTVARLGSGRYRRQTASRGRDTNPTSPLTRPSPR